ncbi:MAG: DUF3467 domain-containing protein [Gammaproteobacteria bacterium]|nr:DUF3467 domain-containing protein [Gammaproteobacteria bacterium]MCP5299329.1 DUF3467 domain-containing protein [Chromatiaceae bacterium]
MAVSTKQSKPKAAATGAGTKIRWKTDNLKNTYANVCNVTSTREEVVFLFGINQAWERGQEQLEIDLTDRIIMSPFGAKRLHQLLGNLISEYETRYGALSVDQAAPDITKN